MSFVRDVNMNPASNPTLYPSHPPLGRGGAENPPGQVNGPEMFQHYQVLRRADGSLWELGRGAMGVTYKAFDTNLRCHVALKVISAQHLHSEMAGQRFIREARVAARLRHRNIASVYHLGVDPQSYFYSMEFVDGETLEGLVRRVGPLPLETVLGIAHQTARALAAASRQGLIHRDIKPANIMVLHQDEEGEDRLLVKVIDFGLARTYAVDDSSPQLTATGFVGTPLYASPEQLEEKPLDVRSDIYSLGITLWILLTGRPPFAGEMTMVITQHLNAEPPWWQLGECPEPARALLGRMLSKEPAQRYQTAGELRLAIEACLLEMTGKGALRVPGDNQGYVGQSLSAPWSVKTDADLTEGSSSSAGSAVPLASGMVTMAELAVEKAMASESGFSRAARASGERAQLVGLKRRVKQHRLPLVGVGVVLVGVLGAVSWHRGAQPTNKVQPAQPVRPLSLTTTTEAEPAATPMPPANTPEVLPAKTERLTPVGPSSANLVNASASPIKMPMDTPAVAFAPSNEPPAQSPQETASPLAGETFTPESRPLPEENPVGTAAASPAPKAAATETPGNDDDDGPDPSTKGHARASTHGHTHHRAHPTPTPAPNFFQRMFGIKPKPKPKSN